MPIFELEARTLDFGKELIRLCGQLPLNIVNKKLIDQVVRSGTSIGANYREANETDSKRDFRNRIRIAKKEAKETMYWLSLLVDVNPEFNCQLKKLFDESQQLMKILGSIYEKTK